MPALQYPTTYTTSTGETKPFPRPSRPLSDGVKTNNITHAFESGHEQRRVKGDPKYTVEFSYAVLDEAQANTLMNFFMQCYGNVKAFMWEHPISKQVYQMRFNMDAFVKENFGHGPKGPLYKVNIKLIQAF